MTKNQLKQKIARLESIQDYLESEISYVDNLLKAVGFPNGLTSAKEVAIEILSQSSEESQNPIENQNSSENEG